MENYTEDLYGNTKSKDEFTQFQTGAVRDTGGKGRMDLLPWSALLRISKHMENALTHYPERNWEKGMPMHCMIDSAFRHLAKYVDGWTDEDHLCAAATNLLMAMWTEEKIPNQQDIPTRLERNPTYVDIQDVSSRTHGEASPLASDASEVRTPTEKNKSQGKAKKTHSEEICDCYDAERKVCMGTKECDPCSCKGNKKKCDLDKNATCAYFYNGGCNAYRANTGKTSTCPHHGNEYHCSIPSR